MAITTGLISGIGSWLLALGKEQVGEHLVKGISDSFSSNELRQAIGSAVQEADEAVPQLFMSCQLDGVIGTRQFVGKFFKERGSEELIKSLEDRRPPNHIFLKDSFWAKAQYHSEAKKIHRESLETWMKAFAVAYFKNTSQYLKFEQLHREYCQRIVQTFNTVNFLGFSIDSEYIEQTEQIASIFVMPEVQKVEKEIYVAPAWRTPSVSHTGTYPYYIQKKLGETLAKRRGETRKTPADEIVKRNRCCLLLGDPGLGKTTFIRYLLLSTAKNQGSFPESLPEDALPSHVLSDVETAAALPILIDVKNLSQNPAVSVLESICYSIQKILPTEQDIAEFVNHRLSRGQALLLFDGLDEIPNISKRYKAAQRIESFLGMFPECRSVITSRPAGYKRDMFSAGTASFYRMLPFSDEKVEFFVEQWCDKHFSEEGRKEEKKEKLMGILKRKSHLSNLSKKPLLLTIIVLIYEKNGDLPSTREKLYSSFVDTLLETWDYERKTIDISESFMYLNRYDWRAVIEKLAFWIHVESEDNEDESLSFSKNSLVLQISKFVRELKGINSRQAEQEAKVFFNCVAKERSGFLQPIGEGRYIFIHKSIQEYLAAVDCYAKQEKIGIQSSIDFIKEKVAVSHWREVILFLMSLQQKDEVGIALKEIFNFNMPFNDLLHRSTMYAGMCLPECVYSYDRAIEKRIVTRLFDIAFSESYSIHGKVCSKAIELIKNLHGTALADLCYQLLVEKNMVPDFHCLFEGGSIPITYSPYDSSIGYTSSEYSINKIVLEIQEAIAPEETSHGSRKKRRVSKNHPVSAR